MIARRAAKAVEKELDYPGRIKITVVRESRSHRLRRVAATAVRARRGRSIGSRLHGRVPLLHRRRRPDRRAAADPVVHRDAERDVPLRERSDDRRRSSVFLLVAATAVGAVELAQHEEGTRLEEANAEADVGESAETATNQEAGSAPADTPAEKGGNAAGGGATGSGGGSEHRRQPGLRRRRAAAAATRSPSSAPMRRARSGPTSTTALAGKDETFIETSIEDPSAVRREGLPGRDDAERLRRSAQPRADRRARRLPVEDRRQLTDPRRPASLP